MSHLNYYLDWTVGTFVVNRDTVLLCHHRNMNQWLPPGGHIEPGELPHEAAVREVLEETGLSVALVHQEQRCPERTDKFCPVPLPRWMDRHHVRGEHSHLGLVYFARLAEGRVDEVRLETREHVSYVWATRAVVDTLTPMEPAVRFYAKEALSSLGGR